MILATIKEQEISFTSDDSSRTALIAYRDHPGLFDHPRHPFADPDKISEILRPALRSFGGFLPPEVTFRIARPLVGGTTQVDLRAIKESFIHAGARDVQFEENA
jgi:hypothetical protein